MEGLTAISPASRPGVTGACPYRDSEAGLCNRGCRGCHCYWRREESASSAPRSQGMQDFLDYWQIEKRPDGCFAYKPTAADVSPTDLKLGYLNGELGAGHWFARHMQKYGRVV